MELEPSQIKFLPSPDGSFPEAKYEFSAIVNIFEKNGGRVFEWILPFEFPPAGRSLFERIPFYPRLSHIIIEYLKDALDQIGLEIISHNKCENGGYMLRISSYPMTFNEQYFYQLLS